MLIVTLVCYRESYGPVLLQRKAARLRKETGDNRYRSKYERSGTPTQIFWMALKRPLKLLFLSPIVFLMALFAAVTYGYLYLMFTTITAIFTREYGFSQGVSGLAYIGFGVGSLLSLLITGRIANHTARKHSAKGCFTPESRLSPMLMGCWLLPIGLFWYGWSAEAHTHWIVPILGTGVFGLGLMTVFVRPCPIKLKNYQYFVLTGLDVREPLPSRLLPRLRRFRNGRKRRPALPRRRAPPTRGSVNVRDARSGMGEFAAGVYCARAVSCTDLL